MPPSPPPRWKAIQGPIKAQRGPGPFVMAKSICSTVASSLSTMCRASRQIASCKRVAMKPGISLLKTKGALPAT